MSFPKFLRRAQAGAYLKDTYGVGSPRTLAKLAVTGGGPTMQYIGRLPVYTIAELDRYAETRISPPVNSTSDRDASARRRRRPRSGEVDHEPE